MTAVELSAIGRSKVERSTPDVQTTAIGPDWTYGITSPECEVRSQRSISRGSLGESALGAGGTQSFHFSAQHNHSLSNAFVFLRGACDGTVHRALTDKALKLFIGTQAQHFFAPTGCISLPQVE